MNRITSDNTFEMNMCQLALNQVCIKDGWAWYRNGPEDELSVCDLIRSAAETLDVDLPMLSDDDLSDLLGDWLQYGTEEPEGVLAILYRALWAMAEVRARLAAYEDTGLEPGEIVAMKIVLLGRELAQITDIEGVSINRICELAKLEKEGRLVELPPNVPLTLEELRKMDGEPVFVTSATGERHEWYIVDVEENELKNPWDRMGLEALDEGYPYKAYRRKPEEGTL